MNRVFDPERLESKNGMIYYMPEELPDMKGLRFLRSGLFMGEMKKKRFEAKPVACHGTQTGRL